MTHHTITLAVTGSGAAELEAMAVVLLAEYLDPTNPRPTEPTEATARAAELIGQATIEAQPVLTIAGQVSHFEADVLVTLDTADTQRTRRHTIR